MNTDLDYWKIRCHLAENLLNLTKEPIMVCPPHLNEAKFNEWRDFVAGKTTKQTLLNDALSRMPLYRISIENFAKESENFTKDLVSIDMARALMPDIL